MMMEVYLISRLHLQNNKGFADFFKKNNKKLVSLILRVLRFNLPFYYFLLKAISVIIKLYKPYKARTTPKAIQQ